MKITSLVIGVDHYSHPEVYPDLHCAVKDASDVAEAFSRLKMDVECTCDEPKDAVLAYYSHFLDKLSQEKYDAAVLYFAGHGMQINRQDCLILQDAPSVAQGSILALNYSLKVNELMQEMNARGDQMNILIIDACRTTTRGIQNTAMDLRVPFQTFIAYSTSPGTSAGDGLANEGHSPFAQAFLNHIYEEGLEIEQLFKTVRRDIVTTGRQQLSWDYSCLVGSFRFNHGQLDPFYGKPYARDAYLNDNYQSSNPDANQVIGLMMSGNAADRDSAIQVLRKEWRNFSADDMFVIGQRVLDGANKGDDACSGLIANVQTMRLFGGQSVNNLLQGIFYGMYFDEYGVLRKRIYATSKVLSDIERTRSLMAAKDAEQFIQKELGEYADAFYYVVGRKEIPTVYVDAEELAYLGIDGEELYAVRAIEVEDEELLEYIDWRDKFVDTKELRLMIADYLQIPIQLLRTNLSKPQYEKRFTKYNIVNLEFDLYEAMMNQIPDEVSVLSSNSYVDGLDDIRIKGITETKDGLHVEGECEVDVHLEFDGTDMGDDRYPCLFEVEMEENSDNEYTMVDYSGKFKVDTSSYYQ